MAQVSYLVPKYLANMTTFTSILCELKVCNHVIAVYSENKLQHYATTYRNHNTKHLATLQISKSLQFRED